MDLDFDKTPVPTSLMAKQGDVKLIRYDDGTRELFDLADDPDEQTNRADAPAYAETRQRLEQALDALPTPWRARPTNPAFPG